MRGLRREIPRELYIGLNHWRVRFAKVLDGEPENRGLCCFADRTIWIKVGLKPRERLATFFHELLHALDDEYKLRLSHKTIYRLEAPIADFFIQNGWITWANWQGKADEDTGGEAEQLEPAEPCDSDEAPAPSAE